MKGRIWSLQGHLSQKTSRNAVIWSLLKKITAGRCELSLSDYSHVVILIFCEKVPVEDQTLQRRQRSNRVGECRELEKRVTARAMEVQLRQTRELDDRFRKRRQVIVANVQLP